MSATLRLDGATVLVTGASRGIGLAIAGVLAESGAWVGMVARDEAALVKAAESVGGHAFPADASSTTAVDALAASVHRIIGGAPTAIVNSAGAFTLAAFVDTDPETFDLQIGANLRAPFLITRAFLPSMMRRGRGHIVNIGSVAGRVPLPGNAAYGASKFGLHGLHEILAAEVRGTGLRTTLIEPAATDTPLWDALDPDHREDLPSRSKMLAPGDVARTVLFALTQPPAVEISHISLRAT